MMGLQASQGIFIDWFLSGASPWGKTRSRPWEPAYWTWNAAFQDRLGIDFVLTSFLAKGKKLGYAAQGKLVSFIFHGIQELTRPKHAVLQSMHLVTVATNTRSRFDADT